ncbi:MAG: RNA 2',3'-cyclic phosphodiesterase [Ignavibacteriaceae bacterium]
MIRLFVALDIPEETKNELFALRRLIYDDDINYRWESIEKIHLTLKFIGSIQEEFLPGIKKCLSFLESFNKINGEINKFGFFFRNSVPGILRVSLKLDPHVYDIINRLNNELAEYGIEPENRKNKPHLTLLRLKEHPGEIFINKFNNYSFKPLKFKSDKIKLIKSELLISGSKYFEIKTYNLN